jgi:hypothetical protein
MIASAVLLTLRPHPLRTCQAGTVANSYAKTAAAKYRKVCAMHNTVGPSTSAQWDHHTVPQYCTVQPVRTIPVALDSRLPLALYPAYIISK